MEYVKCGSEYAVSRNALTEEEKEEFQRFMLVNVNGLMQEQKGELYKHLENMLHGAIGAARILNDPKCPVHMSPMFAKFHVRYMDLMETQFKFVRFVLEQQGIEYPEATPEEWEKFYEKHGLKATAAKEHNHDS